VKVWKQVAGWVVVAVFGLKPEVFRAEAATLLGTLRCQGAVYLNGYPADSGTSVYSGDQVKTGEGQAVISLTKGEVVTPGRRTEVSLKVAEGRLALSLSQGQLAWAVAATRLARVEADGLEFSPAASLRSSAEIALRDDGSLVMAVRRGKISVGLLRSYPVVVSAGEVLLVDPRPAGPSRELSGVSAEGPSVTPEQPPRAYRIEKRSRRDLIPPLIIAGIDLLSVIPHPLAEEESQASPWVP